MATSSASLNDLPTLPNTPEKQAERSAHATNLDGPCFNDFIFHDKTSKSSVQISTLLLPIRIFVRVYEVENNVSSFSQFQEESLLRDYFSHQIRGQASSLQEDSSHDNLNYDESFLQNSKNYDKAGSDKNVFMAILRLSDLTDSTSKLVMNNTEMEKNIPNVASARNRNSSSSRGRGVIINPSTSSKKEGKATSKQDVKPTIATSTTSNLLTKEEQEAQGHFHNKLWNVEYLSIGNGYLAPVFCQNSETNPFAPLMVPLVFKTQQQGKRRGRGSNDDDREDFDEGAECEIDEEDDEQKMLLNKKRMTSSAVNRRTVVVDVAQPIAYPTTATKKKICWSASCGYSQLFSSWSPSSLPLQFHIVVEKNSPNDRNINNKMNRNWNFSMLSAVGSIGFPSYVPLNKKGGDGVNNDLAIRNNTKARTTGPFSTQELLENSQKILSSQQQNLNFDDNFNNGRFFDTSATTSQISLTLLPQQFDSNNNQPNSEFFLGVNSFASPLNSNGAVAILNKNKNSKNSHCDNNNKEIISDNISTVGRNTGSVNHVGATTGKKKQEMSNKNNSNMMMMMMNDKLHESSENLLLTDNVKDEDGDNFVIPKSTVTQTGKRLAVKNASSGSNDSLILVNKQQRAVASSVRKSKAVAKHESFASVTIEEGKKLAALLSLSSSSSSGDQHNGNNNNNTKLNIVTCGLQFSAKEEKWIAKFSSDFLMMNKNNQTAFPAEFIVVSSEDFNRSVKLMCALSTATRILSEDWISEAVDNFPTKSSQIPELVRKHLLQTADDFTVSRRCVAQFNSENSCDIETFVRRVPVSNRRSLLKGRKVFVEKNVIPQTAPNNDVKDVVIAFGGIPDVEGKNDEGFFGNAIGVTSSSTRTSTGSNNGNIQSVVVGGGGKRKSATVNLRFSDPPQGTALLLSSHHDSALPPLILVTSEDKKDKRKNFASNKYAMDVNEFFRRILNLDDFS